MENPQPLLFMEFIQKKDLNFITFLQNGYTTPYESLQSVLSPIILDI